MARVFISYRRDDAPGWAGQINTFLANRFGLDGVFFDISDIPLGADFPSVLKKSLAESDALIVVIGRQWETMTDDTGRVRLGQGDDHLTMEIVGAIARGIPIFPILFETAPVPSSPAVPDGFLKFNWARADNANFKQVMESVASEIERGRRECAASLRSDAARALADGDFVWAVSLLQEALGLVPGDEETLRSLAAAREGLEQKAEREKWRGMIVTALAESLENADHGKFIPAALALGQARAGLRELEELMARAGRPSALASGGRNLRRYSAVGVCVCLLLGGGWWAWRAVWGPGSLSSDPVELVRQGEDAELAKNYSRAATLFSRAADQGFAAGQAELGRLYAAGDGVKRDYAKAEHLYQLAIDQGYADAYDFMGDLYRYGDGMPQNVSQAVMLYQQAAEKNSPYGQFDLAEVLAQGDGVQQDLIGAAKYYKLAANQGYKKAKEKYDELVNSGKVQEQN